METTVSVLKDALLIGKEALTFVVLLVSCYISIAAHKRITAHEREG
jgi:hypothetical protein